jgi:hypothetical protein
MCITKSAATRAMNGGNVSSQGTNVCTPFHQKKNIQQKCRVVLLMTRSALNATTAALGARLLRLGQHGGSVE